MDERDFDYLRRAIMLSQRARDRGNHPFGAILVDANGNVIAEAENTVNTGADPTGHAETNLVRAAGSLVPPADMPSTTLYSSCEPCAMCAAAVFWAGIGRIVYALSNDSLIAMLEPGGDGPALHLGTAEVVAAGNRAIAVEGPALEDDAAACHAGFWA